MEKKRKISEYRERLDKTLSSPDLTNQETLKTLIKNQLLRSSRHGTEECTDKLLSGKTIEVSNLLDKLRSASVKDHEVSRGSDAAHGDWKLKEDNEDFRIMYREGAQGSPFHTLLVEGYVDGPVDACLCVSWESLLYTKWWPQTVFPSFKITNSKRMRVVRIGEQISQVRMKVPWPLKDREAVVHYFLFQYLQDDLIVVLFNTISDLESFGVPNGVSESKDSVTIDIVGGFALQKVSSERSYFRTIAALDIKLDLIPPSLINFISRQLVGNGFRLYQKAVASVAKSDEDYTKALRDPLYVQIREALYLTRTPDEACQEKQLKTDEEIVSEPGLIQDMKNEEECTNKIELELDGDKHARESFTLRKAFCEIEEEEESENKADPVKEDPVVDLAKRHQTAERLFCLSPEVEQALGTLDKVISIVRKYRVDVQNPAMSSSSVSDAEESPPASMKDPVKTSENIENVSHCRVSTETPRKESVERPQNEHHKNSSGFHSNRSLGSNSLPGEGNHNRIAPASPEQDIPTSAITSITATPEVAFQSENVESSKQKLIPSDESNRRNGLNDGNKRKRQQKQMGCCFSFR